MILSGDFIARRSSEKIALIQLFFSITAFGIYAEIAASVAFEINDTLYVPLHDHRGNVTVLLDGNTGNIVESYRYSAFGVETIYDNNGNILTQSNVINPWRFSSKRTDAESGYVYFERRYYDPAVGRWLTQDPLGVKAGPNLYAYVLNCPITSFDLYGLIDVDHNHPFYKDYSDGRSSVDAHYERIMSVGKLMNYSDNRSDTHVTHSSHSSDHNHRVERCLESKVALTKTDSSFWNNVDWAFKYEWVDWKSSWLKLIGKPATIIGTGYMENGIHGNAWLITSAEDRHNATIAAMYEYLNQNCTADCDSTVFKTCRFGTPIVIDFLAFSFIAEGASVATGLCNRSAINGSKFILNGPACSAANGTRLIRHLQLLEEYGACGYKTLQNGRIRYYDKIIEANTPGKMIGRRLVKE